MVDLIKNEHELHSSADDMIENSPLMGLLNRLGTPIFMGSYTTGLMVYPDIDLTIQSSTTVYQDLVNIIPEVHQKLDERNIKIADFSKDESESAVCYIGIEFDYNQTLWHISATITKPGPIISNPADLPLWFKNMSQEQRITILKLKKELLGLKRYGSSHSKPPYTFRSVHLYEGVLVGKAKSVKELEQYFIDI